MLDGRCVYGNFYEVLLIHFYFYNKTPETGHCVNVNGLFNPWLHVVASAWLGQWSHSCWNFNSIILSRIVHVLRNEIRVIQEASSFVEQPKNVRTSSYLCNCIHGFKTDLCHDPLSFPWTFFLKGAIIPHWAT